MRLSIGAPYFEQTAYAVAVCASPSSVISRYQPIERAPDGIGLLAFNRSGEVEPLGRGGAGESTPPPTACMPAGQFSVTAVPDEGPTAAVVVTTLVFSRNSFLAFALVRKAAAPLTAGVSITAPTRMARIDRGTERVTRRRKRANIDIRSPSIVRARTRAGRTMASPLPGIASGGSMPAWRSLGQSDERATADPPRPCRMAGGSARLSTRQVRVLTERGGVATWPREHSPSSPWTTASWSSRARRRRPPCPA